MKKVKCIVVTRNDLKPGFRAIKFKDVNPYSFTDNVTKWMDAAEIVIYVNSADDQQVPDKRSKVLKTIPGSLYGWIIPNPKCV